MLKKYFPALYIVAIVLLLLKIFAYSDSDNQIDLELNLIHNKNLPIVSFLNKQVSKQEIISSRQNYISEHQITDRYRPAEFIFSGIRDECGWVDQANHFILENPLANPLMLAYPDFYSVQLEADLKSVPQNPVVPTATSLSINGNTARLELKLQEPELTKDSPLGFYLYSFNSLDLGFNSVQVNLNKSQNISAADKQEILRNVAAIGCPEAASKEEGYINNVFINPKFGKLYITELPANISLNFWKEQPDNILTGAPADFNFDILLKNE